MKKGLLVKDLRIHVDVKIMNAEGFRFLDMDSFVQIAAGGDRG